MMKEMISKGAERVIVSEMEEQRKQAMRFINIVCKLSYRVKMVINRLKRAEKNFSLCSYSSPAAVYISTKS